MRQLHPHPIVILVQIIRRLWLRITSITAQELLLLLPLLLVVMGVWGFIALADEVGEGGTQRFDDWALRAMRQPDNPALPIGPAWLHEIGRDLTALGGIAVMVLVILAVAGFLFFERKYRAVWLVLAASLSGLVLSGTLKYAFDRPRPSLVPHLSAVYTSSFPSGHSMISAVVYLTLGALLARTVEDRWTRFYCMALAIVVTGLVGISRVYMGVHYPTDVLAGWTAGGAWAVLCWIIAGHLQRRGQVE